MCVCDEGHGSQIEATTRLLVFNKIKGLHTSISSNSALPLNHPSEEEEEEKEEEEDRRVVGSIKHQ